MQREYYIDPDYINTVQREVQPHMRAVLVDWMMAVHQEWKLLPETIYSAIQLVDRYLSRAPVTRRRMQLVGIACMMLACKIEEQHPPTLQDFVEICQSAYTTRQILNAELVVAKRLGFRLRSVSPRAFMARFLDAGRASCGDPQACLTKVR